jgi:hypothetical protein
VTTRTYLACPLRGACEVLHICVSAFARGSTKKSSRATYGSRPKVWVTQWAPARTALRRCGQTGSEAHPILPGTSLTQLTTYCKVANAVPQLNGTSSMHKVNFVFTCVSTDTNSCHPYFKEVLAEGKSKHHRSSVCR